MNKFLKKYWVLLSSLFISSLMNIHYFIPSYSFDGYCSLCSSYSEYALIFIKAGRYFPAFIYYIVDLLSINYNVFSTISIILSILFLSIGVNVIYKDVIKIIGNSKIKRLLIFIGSFAICFSPFNAEFLVFEEGFAMCLGILLSILAGSIFCSKDKYNYIKVFSLLFIATICYQSSLCMFIPYAFLLITLENKNINIIKNIKINWKRYIIGLFIYGMALATSFILLKLVIKIFTLESAKFGTLNILENIKIIYRLFKDVVNSLLFFINKEIFYRTILFLIILAIPFVIMNFKKNINTFIYILIMIGICCLICFVPNIAMNTNANYTAARMISSFGSLPGFIILMLFNFKFTKKDIMLERYFYYLILIISIMYCYGLCKSYYQASSDNYNRYKNDISYLNYIESNIKDIDKYTNIYYVIDSSVQAFYKEPINGNNYRMYFFDWAFDCGYRSYINNNVELEKIDVKEIEDYELIDCNTFEYYSEDNNLYLLLKQ